MLLWNTKHTEKYRKDKYALGCIIIKISSPILWLVLSLSYLFFLILAWRYVYVCICVCVCVCVCVREREREREINLLPPVCAPFKDWTHNLAMFHDQESNFQHFGVWDDAPTNLRHVARALTNILGWKKFLIVLNFNVVNYINLSLFPLIKNLVKNEVFMLYFMRKL